MTKFSAFLAFFIMAVSSANAADTAMVGDLTVSNAWGRASIGANRPGGAYLSIANAGATSDRLIAAATPVAARTELHHHAMNNGILKMRHVQAVDVPSGGETVLKPGGFHIMLFNLKAPLKKGATFPLTLTFEKAGKATVMVHVGKAGAMAPHGSGGHGDHMQKMKHHDQMKDQDHKQLHQEHMKDEDHKKQHGEHMKHGDS